MPYFMIAWCVFFYQSVCVFTNGVCHVFHQNIMFLCFLYDSHVFHQNIMFYVFCKTVLVKKYTPGPCQGMI